MDDFLIVLKRIVSKFRVGHEGKNSTIVEKSLLEEARAIEPYFNREFYLKCNHDVKESGLDPVLHYCRFGWREGRDPSADFSTRGYLESHPDVTAAGLNPFWHYCVAGKAEGRSWSSTSVSVYQNSRGEDDRVSQEASAIRHEFDPDFYIARNPDVAASQLDPMEHFIKFGWKEGRDPNGSFSVAYYLQANPDVRAEGINPFWHYVVAGRREGRLQKNPGGYKAEILRTIRPLQERVELWRSSVQQDPKNILDANAIFAAVTNAIGKGGAGLILSIGHDNYRNVSGGVQNCIAIEEKEAAARGLVYLNISPYSPLPRLSHEVESPDFLAKTILCGQEIGGIRISELADALKKISSVVPTKIIIHHLLGHSAEQISGLVRATGSSDCYFWLHDFFTLCPSHALQRNDVTFCGAPPSDSNSCTLCLYGPERLSHQDRIAQLFRDLIVHVVAPSQFAADFWRSKSSLPYASLDICEHLNVKWGGREVRLEPDSGPAMIAYVGYPAPHKGWHVFERIVRRCRGLKDRYQFAYFGVGDVAEADVQNVFVNVSEADPDAMVRCLSERKVDIVLHWANCAETFSFSAHEAIASGAYVVTNPLSGNVALTVRRTGMGLVLESELELEEFFFSGEFEVLLSELRARRAANAATIARSKMTFTVLDREVLP